MNSHLNYQELIKHMEIVLADAQKQRDKRKSFIEIPSVYGCGSDRIPEWNWYEMEQMLMEVNRIRTNAIKQPLSMAEVRFAEHRALGHSDYSHKFALNCAELIQKE